MEPERKRLGTADLEPPAVRSFAAPGAAKERLPTLKPQLVGPFYFFTYAAVAVLGQFVSVYLRDLGFGYATIGALSAIAATAGAISQSAAGAASDAVRRRTPFVLGASALLGCLYLIYPNARSVYSFAVLHAAAGLLSYTALTAAASLVLDLAPTAETSRSFASARVWGSIGYVAAMVSIVVWPELLSPPKMFYAGAAFYFAASMAVLVAGESGAFVQARRVSMRTGLLLLRQRRVFVLLLFCFLYWVALQGSFSLVALYVKDLGGGRAMMASAWIVAATIEMPFMLWLARLSDKSGRRPVLLVATAALPLRLVAYAFAREPWHVLPVQALHGVTFGIMVVAPMAYMNDIVPDKLRASGQGLVNACLAASSAIGPLIAGILGDVVGLRGAFLGLCAFAVAAAFVLLFLVPESRTQMRKEV
ncbi:MAG: MFS transporter [Armatimonadota bacterium]